VEILKFDPAPRQNRGRNKSMNKSLFAIVGVVAVAALGTTLAGSITLNSGQSVEFGQGVSVTAACDVTSGITLAPSSTFVNAVGTGSFNLGTISFSGIDYSCIGKVFTLKAYDNVANSSALVLNTVGSTFNYATFAYTTVTTANHSSNTDGIYGAPSSLTNGSDGTYQLGIKAGTGVISAQNTYKFTLESSAN
jgi:hypothetical protein